MSEHAIDEWIKNAIPAGSGRYYAILHTPQQSQRHQRAVTTLVSVWSKLCFSNRELEVAQKKLDWWRHELDREGYLHPVTTELFNAGNSQHTDNKASASLDPALLTSLTTILEGYGSLLTSGSPSTEQSNRKFHHATGAAACVALCEGNITDPVALLVSRAGALLSELRCLRHLHKHVNNGLLCLPLADLEAHEIKPNQLVPGPLPDNITNYLANTMNTLQQQIEDCLKDFSSTAITPGEPGLAGAKTVFIYLYIQHKLLLKMQKDVTQIFQPDIRLSPIGNYWQAFKAARQFDKFTNTPDSR